MKLLLAFSVLAALTATNANAADTLYSGGPIITVDDRQPNAEAIVVRDGRIAFVGNRRAARDFSPQAQHIDLQGHTLAPGFIDAHGHVSGVGLQALSANLLPAPDGEGNSIPALQKIMREFRAHPTTAEGYKVLIG
ncbi:MAG TPA: amidohydrolase family protein, partial [Stenotrophomonas sp.]